VPVESRNKEAVIAELIGLLDANGALVNRDAALNGVLSRERIQSTGIGAGIAIPHCKCAAVKEVVMAIGIAHEPIEFESIDGRPVTFIFLLVSPTNQTGLHIQALAAISRLMLNEQVRHELEKADSAEVVTELLGNHDSE